LGRQLKARLHEAAKVTVYKEDFMELRRAVITGLGTINPLANNMDGFWAAACRGQSGVGYISHFDAGAFRTRIGAEVKDFRPDELLGARQAKRLDRYAQFALAAAMEAITDSGIELSIPASERTAVVVGTGIGGMGVFEGECSKYQQVGPARTSPFLVPRIMPNAAAAAISIHFGFKGPCLSVSSACASATDAIATARDLIRTGRNEVVLAGGAEAALTPSDWLDFARPGRCLNEMTHRRQPADHSILTGMASFSGREQGFWSWKSTSTPAGEVHLSIVRSLAPARQRTLIT
jgi:3-oxoacyl-[acyl-carrier-protein] synthase II